MLILPTSLPYFVMDCGHPLLSFQMTLEYCSILSFLLEQTNIPRLLSIFLIGVVIFSKGKIMHSGRDNDLNSKSGSVSLENHLHSRIFYRREINILNLHLSDPKC
jgi:hypothetical protein